MKSWEPAEFENDEAMFYIITVTATFHCTVIKIYRIFNAKSQCKMLTTGKIMWRGCMYVNTYVYMHAYMTMVVSTQIFFKLRETNKNQLKCINLKTILTNESNQRMDKKCVTYTH